MQTLTFDAIIIGFGKAGKTLAVALAKAGQRVALVERSPAMYGGTCINIACIPTKTLVSAAAHHLSFEQAMERKNAVVARLNDKNYRMLANNDGVSLIDGVAAFEDAHTVRVTAADDAAQVARLQAPQIFINTGATPLIPDISGSETAQQVYTSTSLLDQATRPDRLAIIGGGYIGLEYASTYAALGSQVTLYERGQQIMPREDPAIAEAVVRALTGQGINLVCGAIVQALSNRAGVVSLRADGQEHPYDAVLLATGRRPATAGLNLAAAGVEVDDQGAVVVDERLRTSVNHIWAMGDVTGGPQFTYASLDDFRIVKSQLLGDGSYTRAQRKTLPYAVFMQTPLGRVGLTEAEARASGHQVVVKELPAMAVPRLHVDGATQGLLRAVVDARTKRILGASLLCQGAPEVINLIKTVMDADLPYTSLQTQIFTHPTVSEALNDLFAD